MTFKGWTELNRLRDVWGMHTNHCGEWCVKCADSSVQEICVSCAHSLVEWVLFEVFAEFSTMSDV